MGNSWSSAYQKLHEYNECEREQRIKLMPSTIRKQLETELNNLQNERSVLNNRINYIMSMLGYQ